MTSSTDAQKTAGLAENLQQGLSGVNEEGQGRGSRSNTPADTSSKDRRGKAAMAEELRVLYGILGTLSGNTMDLVDAGVLEAMPQVQLVERLDWVQLAIKSLVLSRAGAVEVKETKDTHKEYSMAFVSRSRLGAPKQFNGDPNEMDDFLISVENHLASAKDASEEEKIRFLLSYTVGAPARWITEWLRTLDKQTFEEFRLEFEAEFGLALKERLAGLKLMKLRQGSASVLAYIGEFRKLASMSKFNEAALKIVFETGLSPTMSDALNRAQLPSTLAGLIEVV